MDEPARNPDEDNYGEPAKADLRAIEGGGETSEPAGDGRLKVVPSSIYDDPASKQDDGLTSIKGGGETTGGKGKLGVAGSDKDPNKKDSSKSILGKEKKGGSSDKGAVGKDESMLGKGFTAAAEAGSGGNPLVRALAVLARNKRRTAAGGVVSAVVVIFMVLFGVAQGPLQFIHFAQLLQQFHLRSNEDFSDNRAMKVLVYGLVGLGAENGRLGVPGNAAANVWEGRLLEQTGMRPVYSETTGRQEGFILENEAKAQDTLGDIGEKSNPRTSKKLEASMGKGARMIKAGEVASSGNDYLTLHGERVPDDARVLYLRDVSFKDRRLWIRTIGKETNVFRIANEVGSRLLIKRAGLNFHPLEKIGFRQWLDKRADKKADKKREKELRKEYEKELRDKRTKNEVEGVKGIDKVGAKETTDADGNTQVDPADVDASDEATKLIDQFKTTGAVKIGASAGAAVVGVLCAAKSFGDHIPDYKYANSGQPMMRMGWDALTQGHQVMVDGPSMDELSVFAKSFYDPETKTSALSAKGIKANLGEDTRGSTDVPTQAQLKNLKDKPAFFDFLDSIGPLGATCGAVDTFLGLPVISNVASVLGDIESAVVNAALSLGNTSQEEIVNMALKVVSGKSVDPEKKGGEYGALADTGVHLDGISQAATMGGVAQPDKVSAELKAGQDYVDQQDNQTKSFAGRYLDPYNPTSLVASAIGHYPSSTTQLASVFTAPFSGLGGVLSKFSSLVSPSAHAVGPNEIYGIPAFGFSEAEQNDSRFENPYDNAKIVEDKAHDGKLLKEMNDKWGKCFGMRVTADDNGVHIETQDQNSDEVNMFKVIDDKDCQHPSASIASTDGSQTGNKSFWSKLAFWKTDTAMAAGGGAAASDEDIEFERFRFYLADSQAAITMACWEGVEGDYCQQAGFDSSAGASADAGAPTETAGATIDMEHLYDSSVDIACAPGTKDIGVQKGYTEGKLVKIRVCGVSSVTETGDKSPLEGADGKLLVNSRLSAFYVKLVEDMKAGGVGTITAQEGFRTMARQTYLYNCGCADGPAPPGYSNHQMGIAVDWPAQVVSWLTQHGSDYGLKSLVDGDPEHWSPTGY